MHQSEQKDHTADEAPPQFKLNRDRSTAVALDHYWIPIGADTPRGVKLLLLGAGGVAQLGLWDGKTKFWTHWVPMPKKREVQNAHTP